MDRLIFTFGNVYYEVVAGIPDNKIPDSWTQSEQQHEDGYPMEQPFCIDCGAMVTYVFPARINPNKAGQGAGYMEPVGVRCDCHLEHPDPSGFGGYTIKLKTDPVWITRITSPL